MRRFATDKLIAGSVLPVIFSSGGPIFYDRIVGAPDFLPMVDRLTATHEEVHLSTVRGIELLWHGYLETPGWPRFGISAFPSMHVCMAMQVYLYTRCFGRVWRWAGFAFLLITLLGSVHLGWHWLVDGLASIIIAWLVWKACERFSRWWLPETA